MKVLVDTNVALDFLLHRKDYIFAMDIFGLAEKKYITGYISASAITDIFFLAKGKLGKKSTKEALKDLLKVFSQLPYTTNIFIKLLIWIGMILKTPFNTLLAKVFLSITL